MSNDLGQRLKAQVRRYHNAYLPLIAPVNNAKIAVLLFSRLPLGADKRYGLLCPNVIYHQHRAVLRNQRIAGHTRLECLNDVICTIEATDRGNRRAIFQAAVNAP